MAFFNQFLGIVQPSPCQFSDHLRLHEEVAVQLGFTAQLHQLRRGVGVLLKFVAPSARRPSDWCFRVDKSGTKDIESLKGVIFSKNSTGDEEEMDGFQKSCSPAA